MLIVFIRSSSAWTGLTSWRAPCDIPLLLLLCIPLAFTLSPSAALAADTVVRASALGAHLDTNLMNGGGTDDTATLQRFLDRAATGIPIDLIVDGPVLVSGLDVYGNTTIECITGAGLYLKDGSNRALIRNAHRSRDVIRDGHITFRGCFLNGNRKHQVAVDSGPEHGCHSKEDAAGTFMDALQFFGVNDLTLENDTVWSPYAYGVEFANANKITVHNVTIDHGAASDDVHAEEGCTDGLAFRGANQYITIDSVKIRTGDDAISFNTSDSEGPYAVLGPITDVSVNNLVVMHATSALRFLSATQRIDKVVVNNVTGVITSFSVVSISHFIYAGLGDIGSITLSNINVDRPAHYTPTSLEVSEYVRKSKVEAYKTEFDNGVFPLVNVNAHIDNLILHNFVTTASDNRAVIRIGPETNLRTLSVDMTIIDPTLRSTPLKLDKGSHIETLNLSLNWQGKPIDQGRNPIENKGGTIAQLNWLNTPPTYVGSKIIDGNVVTTTFNQSVKASDFKAGVSIRANGKPLQIAIARRQACCPDVIQYVVKEPIRAGAKLTWDYDAAVGDIHNWSGDQLQSVSAKVIRAERS